MLMKFSETQAIGWNSPFQAFDAALRRSIGGHLKTEHHTNGA
jgi:hypothetical protein